MYCPNCGAEYQAGFVRCADCDVALVAAPPREPTPEPLRLTNIARFRDLSEAHLAKGRLEAEGLTVALQDEHLIGLDWRLSTALGGVKLQVLEEESDDAARSLQTDHSPALLDASDHPTWITPQDLCGECGSSAVTLVDSRRQAAAYFMILWYFIDLVALLWAVRDLPFLEAMVLTWVGLLLLVAVPAVLRGSRRRCEQCGFVWKPPPFELKEAGGARDEQAVAQRLFWVLLAAMALIAMLILRSYGRAG